MPAQPSAVRPGNTPLSVEARAAALWAFIQAKTPSFSLGDAIQLVRRLALDGEDTKSLAKRLRTELRANGVNLKHMHALQAAALVSNGTSFYSSERAPVFKLRLSSFCAPGSSFQERTFTSWNDLTEFMREVADGLISRGLLPLQVMTVRFNGRRFEFTAPVRCAEPENEHRVVETPLFQIQGLTPDWLSGAPAFVEKVRRHLEERGKAVLDGSEVIHLCADQPTSRGTAGEIVFTDAANTELVLLREDDEDDPSSGYEIARGDEVICWHQLELSVRDDATNEMPALDIVVPREGVGAWFVNGNRYVWALETLHPKEYVPGRTTLFIGPDACDRLLRRYRLAKRLHGDTFKHHPLNKPLDYLSGVPDTYRIDLHYLLRLLQNADLTWDQCVNQFSETPLEMQPVLPVGFVFQVLEKLQVPEPNKVFALPNMSEMAKVEDDGLLRALMPRVQSVRAVRPWGIHENVKKALDEALETFGAGRRLQILYADGGLRSDHEMPYLVYASDAQELYAAVEELGFTMYAAVTPHLLSVQGLLPSGTSSWPWALGHALFLRFARRGDMQ